MIVVGYNMGFSTNITGSDGTTTYNLIFVFSNSGSQWNIWEPYGECCKGKQTRKRTCGDNYVYGNEVVKCYGDVEQKRKCPGEYDHLNFPIRT